MVPRLELFVSSWRSPSHSGNERRARRQGAAAGRSSWLQLAHVSHMAAEFRKSSVVDEGGGVAGKGEETRVGEASCARATADP